MTAPRCTLCGGNAGRLNDDGVHMLCAALKRLGRPTPCLGIRCEPCNGNGRIPRSPVGPILGGGPASDARALAAWARTCERCHGTGLVPYSRDKPPENGR